MLIEIQCNLFREKTISFHEGFNVVQGDDIGSNSIGKTTTLMIIDFVFGGDSFLKNNGDAIEILGNHNIKFAFKFSNKKYFFSRETNNSEYVNFCNSEYILISSIKIEEFKIFLKENYNLQDLQYLTFRDIIGLYSRIFGKNNYDIKKPLNISKESDKNAIIRLIKLFNKYKSIELLDSSIKLLTNQKKSVTNASKYGFLPKTLNKSTYSKALKEIEIIEAEITQISKEIEVERCNLDAIASKDIIDLRSKIGELRLNKNIKNNELQYTKINLTTQNKNIRTQLSHLVEFFPNIDLDRLITIESFHNDISSILKEKLKEKQKNLEKDIKKIEEKISQLNQEINNIINKDEKNVSKYVIEKLIALALQKAKNQDLIQIYESKLQIDTDLNKDKNNLLILKKDIQLEINQQINNEIENLNQNIYKDGRKAPKLILEDNKYSFNVLHDTGTGKAFSSLLTFDLAIFLLTPQPILIHDSMLFKNIEDPVIEQLINIYRKQKKQTFISLDGMFRYNIKTQKILDKYKVLSLSSEKTLYKIQWNKNK